MNNLILHRHDHNELTEQEAERLALLAEEMGEALQAIGKVLRHGYNSRAPGETDRTNRKDLAREIGDVLAIVELMRRAADVPVWHLEARMVEKFERLKLYTHHQPERLLDDKIWPFWAIARSPKGQG